MMQKEISLNYKSIIHNIFSYLPSRFLIILNSILIIPLLSKSVDYNEMSIYLIAVQILNLICTCSSDGIGKIVLRFYEKYKFENKLDKLFSNIFVLSIIIYFLTFIVYLLTHNIISEHFAIPNYIIVLTFFLVIPCGIRQMLYQILRIQQNSKLYTFSIIGYQILFVILFMIFTNKTPNAMSILHAMLFAVFAIDIIIICKTTLKQKITFDFDKNILHEVLKYSIPLFFTNASYWFILNISKFIFQYQEQYSYTSIAGIAWTFTNWIIQPLVTVFIFSAFPVIVEKFELKDKLNNYFTNLIQLYCFLFIPIGSIFCFLADNISNFAMPATYKQAAILFPCFAISVGLHEFTKLINIKYHLKNKTYLEFILAAFTAAAAIGINIFAIKYYGLFGAAIALLCSESLLLILNVIIKFKYMEYINYKKIFKTSILTTTICVCSFFAVSLIFQKPNRITFVIEILSFLALNYFACYLMRNKILS